MRKELKLLRVFSSPTRLKIIVCLEKEPKTVGELIEVCRITQSAVSQHLLRLKSLGLVEGTKKGRKVYYALKNKEVAKTARHLQRLLEKLT